VLPGHVFRIYPHAGKGKLPRDLNAAPDPLHRGLLDQLPAKLRAFAATLDPATDRIVVLVDLDDSDGGDCTQFLARLTAAVDGCGAGHLALVRIAIEETEAFYLGDQGAVRRAFGGVRRGALRGYEQDSCCGTWELFQRLVGAAVEDKVGWAEKMGPELGTTAESNLSPSFGKLVNGLRRWVGESG